MSVEDPIEFLYAKKKEVDKQRQKEIKRQTEKDRRMERK